jgi:hypothetical protein
MTAEPGETFFRRHTRLLSERVAEGQSFIQPKAARSDLASIWPDPSLA